jgi:hypothetical protein
VPTTEHAPNQVNAATQPDAGRADNRDPLCDLAQRHRVRRSPRRQDDLRFDRRAADESSAGSDRHLSDDGDRDLIPGVCTTSLRRLRPVDGFSLCAKSANTRMRQPVDLVPTYSRTSTHPSCSKSDAGDPSLWVQPLHTRIKWDAATQPDAPCRQRNMRRIKWDAATQPDAGCADNGTCAESSRTRPRNPTRAVPRTGILYAIWRDGTEYDGRRGAKII